MEGKYKYLGKSRHLLSRSQCGHANVISFTLVCHPAILHGQLSVCLYYVEVCCALLAPI